VNREAAQWLKKLHLQKHPEGGYFKETYRSDLAVDIANYNGLRQISTVIYYMLVGNQFSAFHRIKSDETWHHYAGGPLTLYAIKNEKMARMKLGKESPQITIEANTWFAASLDENSYCLIGCTVSPGFDYRDWELGKRAEMVKMYPQHKKIIQRHTIV